ncbi:hypothetical protein DL764_009411 [Monosporascus ibericus]|uniref:DNA mismatch repair proteins mutS family domain-containing protein n=1 Tax=Monosporascus ibericus TaxID=155417 RepID=A0A4Q4SV26_9PEZI|nr:hypothetical protein DL764_009411 [Monosporascus ibericus]
MYEPSVILIVNTASTPNPKSNLVAIIEEELAGTPIEPLDRKYWSENSGLEFIQTLAFKEDLQAITVAIQGNFYATCSFAAHVEDINRDYEITAEVRFDSLRQFWLRLRRSDFENRALPDILINVIQKGVWIECQTLILVQLNNRITDSHNEAVMLSDKVIQELVDGIRAHVPNLFRVCEGIALLDMIASFGQLVTTRDYVRPEIGTTLALKAARHPICEQLNPGRFVPNDAFANEQHRFQIITGCNMSGKSTYMRMISLLQVMAQVGCFVPAEYAAFPIIQHLFVRTSTDDSLEANMSTFSLEMREVAFILSSGPVQERHYGLDLARAIGFPAQFIETAEKVSKALEDQIEKKKADSQSRRLARRRKLILNLYETLTQLRDSGMDDDALGSYMRRLQSEFIARMDEIEGYAPPAEAESVEEIE